MHPGMHQELVLLPLMNWKVDRLASARKTGAEASKLASGASAMLLGRNTVSHRRCSWAGRE